MLEGKVAIVTGSARGIGRATAELLAEHGAAVSRMARGNPAVVAELRFEDYADGAGLLDDWLARHGNDP